MRNKVFLGGTCGNSNWRKKLTSVIQVDWFNPVVENWTEDCIEIEEVQKASQCNIHLYVITAEMRGVYSIAEVIQSSLTKGKVTILHIIPEGFDESQLKSLKAVLTLVQQNGGIGYIDDELNRTVRVLNYCFK